MKCCTERARLLFAYTMTRDRWLKLTGQNPARWNSEDEACIAATESAKTAILAALIQHLDDHGCSTFAMRTVGKRWDSASSATSFSGS